MPLLLQSDLWKLAARAEQVLADGERRDALTHTLAVMDDTGDTPHSWSAPGTAEAVIAQQAFETYKERGYAAFRVNTETSTEDELDAVPIREFDPHAESIVMHPPIIGG